MKKVLLSVLTLLTISGNSIAQNLPSYLPANGLVGWWPFNGNANDESGNNNNGTVNGAALTADRFGNVGKAYGFDGVTSFVEFPDSVLPSVNQSYSISFWALLNVDGGRIESYTIFDDRDQTSFNSKGRFVVIGNNPNSYWYQMGDNTPCTSNGLQISSWTYISCVYNNETNSLYLYKNGILDCSTTCGDSDFHSGARKLWIGKGQAPGLESAEEWRGSLDDIAIYNRALSQQEITALYNATNCANNLSISPTSLNLNSGSPASFTATTTDPNPVYSWQSDLGLGFQNLSNYGQYSGVGSNNLQVAGLQLRNHQQKFRVISTSGNCLDTSDVATIALNDTCINVVNDTNFITVTDTLRIIITAASGLVQNTLKAYPNPTAGMLFINTGNYAIMPGYSIRISSATGQEVYNSEVNQQLLQVPVENLSPEGLFYLRLYDASGTLVTTRKIVLQ